MYDIDRIDIRNILNSGGTYSIEAELSLTTGETGIASASTAIRGGRREKSVTAGIHTAIEDYNSRVAALCGPVHDQQAWDEKLERHMPELGTDIVLSLSLAFARAAAMRSRKTLTAYVQELSATEQLSPRKTYLVPVFSGGVHGKTKPQSIQQIMFTISSEDFRETVDEILAFYGSLEKRLSDAGLLDGYSASSGFMVSRLSVEEQLALLTGEIRRSPFADRLSIALDVAAEHLKTAEGYRFYGKLLTADQLEDTLLRYAAEYPITYIEDPFDDMDRDHWITFRRRLPAHCTVFADDITATQTEYVDTCIAGGTIIKMKQVGTLSGALKMIRYTHELGLLRCVSHRSYETEDGFMCDLGVAVNAEYMKIGGPRRGDRVCKYNQLLRIFSRENMGKA